MMGEINHRERDAMRRDILALKGLSKYYTAGQNVVMALNQVELSFSLGEFVAITGESGSGKSTLAQVLGGILPYEGGELLVDGRPTSHYDSGDWERYRRDMVSYVAQDYGILPGNTVLDNVVCALRLGGMDDGESRRAAEDALRRVELWELKNRRAAKLSSGQKQRLAIARALAKPAPILIADEPTGNLDPENSAAVIRLLAEAARDRLVILITHEFGEAEGLATRHIALRDGQVVMDGALGDPEGVSKVPAAGEKKPRRLGLYAASLQLRSRPVWCGLMLGLFALTAFALFAFAGTFIANLDDTMTRYYDDSAFRNGDSRRIAVVRPDGEALTDGECQALLELDYVKSLERYSYLNDVQYAYLKEEHYKYRYSTGSGEEGDLVSTLVVLNNDAMPFLRTIPRMPEGEEFLAEGRLPDHIYEVVAGDPTLLGQTFPVYIHDEKHWGVDAYLCFEVTVVGTTGLGDGLWFHEDLGRTLTAHIMTGMLVYLPVYEGLPQGEALVSLRQYERYYKNSDEPWGRLVLQDAPRDRERSLLRLVTGAIPSTFFYAVGVTAEDFEILLYSGVGGQVSLWLEDYAYTGRVLEEVLELGYAAVSPLREGAGEQDEVLAGQRSDTLRVCAAAFLAVLLLQVAVLHAMFALNTESCRILSRVGMDSRTAVSAVYLQVLLFALGGQVLAVGVVALCRWLEVDRVTALLCWLTPLHGAALSLLHLGASLLTALWSARALRRKLYPNESGTPDLDWSEWEVSA